jgi:hypothetical protein
MIAVGSQPPQAGQSGGKSQAQITAAASRFAALSPGARHAWLAAHLRALESGQVALGELP